VSARVEAARAVGISDWPELEGLPLGSAHEYDFALDRLADGGRLTIPVKVAVGRRRRPRCVAVAGIHGDESEGMLALLDFWRACDPADLDGVVILVPVANPPAFRAHRRTSPLDGLDLNRSFPGRPDGTPSERTAYRLLHEIVAGADFLFTLHSWYSTGSVVPYVEVPGGDGPIAVRSYEAARAAGFRRVRRGDWPPGLLVAAANSIGIPGIEAEIGGQGASDAANRTAYVDHLMRLLQHLGIRRGSPPDNPSPEVYGRGSLLAPCGGMLRLTVEPGAVVAAGTLLATITDLHGQPLAEMRAPHSGLVAAVRRFVSVNPGEHVFAFFPPGSPPAGT
jgi:predicted deacylase